MDNPRVLHFEIAQPTGRSPATPAANGAQPDARRAEDTSKPQIARTHKPEKLMRLLSDRNLKLLRLIRTAQPKTLAELSRLSGRPKASLTRTLARLSELGIVVLRKSKGRGKTPVVMCDRVHLEVNLVPEDQQGSDNRT